MSPIAGCGKGTTPPSRFTKEVAAKPPEGGRRQIFSRICRSFRAASDSG
jgi:hypothetical protein